ncbi:hypothetical protein ScPMuIL_014668 [Solemya velum]
MSWNHDVRCLARGLELVRRALVETQRQEYKQVWENSSVRPLVRDIGYKVEEVFSNSVSKPQELQKAASHFSALSQQTIVLLQSLTNSQTDPHADHKTGESPSYEYAESHDMHLDNQTVGQTRAESHDSQTETDHRHYEQKRDPVSVGGPSDIPEVDKEPSDMGEAERTVTSSNMKRETTSNQTTVPQGRPSMQDSSARPRKTTSRINLDQKLSASAKERKVPASRISRVVNFGSLAAGIGMGALAEITKRSFGMKKETESRSILGGNLFLTEANAQRIVDTLCRVRGAALKLGQIISIQDNTLISPELQGIFERVRQSADFMPVWQMEKVLSKEFGLEWRSKLASFDEVPFAAASIGQVHRGVLHDGRVVAMKIQYPGVAKSIDSDINNLMSILKVWQILPKGLYIENLMKVAGRELRWEVDYLREAKCMKKFRSLLDRDPVLYVPEVIDELSTKQVLTTEYVQGMPFDKCMQFDEETKNKLGKSLLNLCLREVFEWHFMQTDPNWSNFLYNPETDKIILLDFGASREFKKDFVDEYIRVIRAASDGDRKVVLEGSKKMGFLTGYESKVMEEAHTDAVMILGEAFATDAHLTSRTSQQPNAYKSCPVMLKYRLTPPPEETYSLHRKMSGTFLLCTKLQCKINCRQLFDRYGSRTAMVISKNLFDDGCSIETSQYLYFVFNYRTYESLYLTR